MNFLSTCLLDYFLVYLFSLSLIGLFVFIPVFLITVWSTCLFSLRSWLVWVFALLVLDYGLNNNKPTQFCIFFLTSRVRLIGPFYDPVTRYEINYLPLGPDICFPPAFFVTLHHKVNAVAGDRKELG